jgi:hypothetical protein
MSKVVKHLPSMCKALGLSSNITQKKKKQKKS